jgi:hypothetical protein
MKSPDTMRPMSPICSYTFSTGRGVYHDDVWSERGIDEGLRLWSNGTCPYCQALTITSVLAEHNMNVEKLTLCSACGWWGIRPVNVGSQHSCEIIRIRSEATLYDVKSLDAPVACLRDYLRKHPKNIAFVHPTKFEELVIDCLRSRYTPCDVIHFGGYHAWL